MNPTYNIENKLVFIVINPDLVYSHPCGRVYKHRLAKSGIVFFLYINEYQRVQWSYKIYVVTTGENITSLKITAQLPGGTESFIKHLDEAIEELIYIWQQSYALM